MAENGCSLEDCYTNIFALTDLAGIKWCKLSHQNASFFGDPLEDPLLLAFSKCIQADILCVWRRQPRSAEARPVEQMAASKELWAFWYGDEPATLQSIFSEGNFDIDQGSWENGLSYECRTLLFKALHNLIERCLVSQNYVRVGKWFVQPYRDQSNPTARTGHLSMSFLFFLHGESTVCASVDVRQHPPLHILRPAHMTAASHVPVGHARVLLAPFGLDGYLTGRTYSDIDPKTHKLLDDWRRYFCVPTFNADSALDDVMGHLPVFVEVVVAGVRLRYPSSFVLLTSDVDIELMKVHSGLFTQPSPGMTSSSVLPDGDIPSSKPHSGLGAGAVASPVKAVTGEQKLDCSQIHAKPACRTIEKMWQDSTVNSGIFMHGRSMAIDSDNREDAAQTVAMTTAREFGEPMQKSICLCSKNRSLKNRQTGSQQSKSNASAVQWAAGNVKHFGERIDKTSRHSIRSSAPYHRRLALSSGVATDFPSLRNLKVPTLLGSSSTSSGTQILASVLLADSPHSAAPSPLTATPTQQPPANQAADPMMPTLSPHPPLKLHGADARDNRGDACGTSVKASDSIDSSVSGANVAPSARNPSLPGGVVIKTEPQLGDYGSMGSSATGEVMHMRQLAKLRSRTEPRRPMLKAMFEGEDDEELVTSSFYEYSLDSFIDPVGSSARRVSKTSTIDLSPPCSVSPPPSNLPVTMLRTSTRSPASDPYQFSDDIESADSVGSVFKMRDMRTREDSMLKPAHYSSSRLEDASRRDSDIGCNGLGDFSSSVEMSQSPVAKIAPSTTLMRENDLIPNIQDLENIFDTDEEVDSDSPPCTSMAQSIDDVKTIQPPGGAGHSNTSLSGDLSRMFPTPPSPPTPGIASPMMQGETILSTETLLGHDVRHHMHHHQYHSNMATAVCSASADQPSSISAVLHLFKKECPFVHRPPLQCVFPSSKMYEPIELPSTRLHPLSVAERRYQRGSGFMSSPNQPDVFPTSIVPFQVMETHRSRRTDQAETMQPHVSAGPVNLPSQRTPISFEMMSPASSGASSFYAGRTVGSVDTQCHSVVGASAPEVLALFAMLALCDSPLGVFRDENFDSCTICVCNMNIDGADVGTLLPARRGVAGIDDQFRCSCAFSAIVNRRRAQCSGLLYEDEIEITGMRHGAFDHRKPSLTGAPGSWGDVRNGGTVQTTATQAESIPEPALQLLREHLSSLYPSYAIELTCHGSRSSMLRVLPSIGLEDNDGRESCIAALEYGRQAATSDGGSQSRIEENRAVLHPWAFKQNDAKIVTNSTNVLQLLKSLQPLLQDAIQKKRSTRLWESVYTISGPLTWKDFHLLAGRGSEEASEPKPVPSLLVGYDQEWLTVSPNAVRYWETLMLEPYGQPRDIHYVIVAPENDYVLSQVAAFFQHLSVMYEQCRLGRHRPVSDKLRDGIMRVGRANAQKVADEPLDDWFRDIGSNSPVALQLKLYAQICQKLLAPFLSMCFAERKKAVDEASSKLVYQPYNRQQPLQSQQQPPGETTSEGFLSPPSTAAVSSDGMSSFDNERVAGGDVTELSTGQNVQSNMDVDREQSDGRSIVDGGTGVVNAGDNMFVVVYMVDCFSYSQQSCPADMDESLHRRLTTVGLMQCFNSMLKAIPEHLHSSIQLQVLPLQTLIDCAPSSSRSQLFKNLSFSIYANCKQILSRSALLSRSLTGFGPIAGAQKVLQNPVGLVSNSDFVLTVPPFILAPPRDSIGASLLDAVDRSNVLLCAYCLSEDQRWLLASCTDLYGEHLETSCINIEVPLRSRRRTFSVRRVALQKLWDFLLGVMGRSTTPWRVVIGRFGRLGHGELKGWSAILSRRNLRVCNERLRASCRMCHLLGDSSVPCVVSACVISTELNPSIHILLDCVKTEDGQRSRKPLSTPSDASCTHILVFPTSATAQANLPMNPQETHLESGFDDNLMGLVDDGEAIEDDMDLMHDLFGACNGSLNKSPTHHDDADRFAHPGGNTVGRDSAAGDLLDMETEELSNHNLLQQPLAVGFYVSTAPTGPLPSWFWSACPQRENLCPVCLRAALHIHCAFSQQKEELIHNLSQAGTRTHPLDSQLTCDVLRYVLETYNSLSWLTVNPSTGERRSCLPAHIYVLMQLYHGFDALV